MAPDKIYNIIIYIVKDLETKSWCQNFLEVIICCITFDLSVILKDGPIKQYYSSILRDLFIPMSYDLHIV